MIDLNRVLIAGRLVRDPEMRIIGDKHELCEFSIAYNARRKGEEVAHFYEVKAWGKTGLFVESYFKKGKAILIEGRIEHERWENKEGQQRSRHIIVAERVGFGESMKEQEGEGSVGRHTDERRDVRSEADNDKPPVEREDDAPEELPF